MELVGILEKKKEDDMSTLKGKEKSLEYVSSAEFLSCPAGRGNICSGFSNGYDSYRFCKALFHQVLSNCPCFTWNKDYAREYYWQAMNPFFE